MSAYTGIGDGMNGEGAIRYKIDGEEVSKERFAEVVSVLPPELRKGMIASEIVKYPTKEDKGIVVEINLNTKYTVPGFGRTKWQRAYERFCVLLRRYSCWDSDEGEVMRISIESAMRVLLEELYEGAD